MNVFSSNTAAQSDVRIIRGLDGIVGFCGVFKSCCSIKDGVG